MFNHYVKLSLSLLLSLALIGTATAAETIQSARQKLETFNQSSDHAFAPATAAKAQAYLGAAMLAAEEGRSEEMNVRIAKALTTLNEAEETASQFRQKFSEILTLKKSSELVLEHIIITDPLKEPNPKRLLQKGNEALGSAIRQFESGQLGMSQQSAEEAKSLYAEIIEISLPDLADKAGSIISKAAAAGARNYAPVTYTKAKTEFAKMERYIDGITLTAPTDPIYTITLAERSLKIAQQVKRWRKKTGSHEELVLGARSDRLKLAQSLGIPVDPSDANSDVSIIEITDAISSLQNELVAEKDAHQSDLVQLETKHKQQLENRISEQRTSLLSKQNEQLSNLKEAFRAKLERETFENRRQKQVRSLFKKGAVDILVKLDGSLLVRLTGLQFATGSSKVDASYYDLLGNLKQALEIYGERNVRIEGHTDSKGDVKINQKISLKRAEAVRDFLIAAAMDGSRLKALGYGEVRPIASNEFKKGRSMNRRIDVVIEARHD
ncbi:MAG: OmpA family protein [Mariprofundaceae bacterium]